MSDSRSLVELPSETNNLTQFDSGHRKVPNIDNSPPPAKQRRLIQFLRSSRPLRQLRTNTAAMLALVFICLVVFLAVFGSTLAPHDPNAQNLANSLAPPGSEHWLGTDMYGRDILSRLLAAAQVTTVAVVQAVGIAAVLGIPVGLLAGLIGGWVGALFSRISDALQSLPHWFLPSLSSHSRT